MSAGIERGPDDYEHERFRYRRDRSSSHGEASLLRWLLGLVSTLMVAAILGAWKFSADFAALSADVRNLKENFGEFRSRIESRYRGERRDAN